MTATAERARRVVERVAAGLTARGGEGVDEVMERLAEQDVTDAAFQLPGHATKPAVRFFDHCLKALDGFDPQMAADLRALVPELHWAQSASYSDDILGEGFTDNYAWAQVIGEQGFFHGDDFHLGFLLLGPQRHYLDHYHPAPELYWPLTHGSLWKKGSGDYIERSQGEVIWHPSLITHATITKDQPLLAMYVWTKWTETSARLVALDEPRHA